MLGGLIDCPTTVSGASIAVKINDTSMEPKLKKRHLCIYKINTPLDNRDIGLFSYNNKLLIRKFIIRKDGVVLRAGDKEIPRYMLRSKRRILYCWQSDSYTSN